MTSFQSLHEAVRSRPSPSSSSTSPTLELSTSVGNVRSDVLELGCVVGSLCAQVKEHVPLDDNKKDEHDTNPLQFPFSLTAAMASVLLSVVRISDHFGFLLSDAILKKMALNARKYPVELCKGKSGKYTTYSKVTGITKTEGQSTIFVDETASSPLPTSVMEKDNVPTIQEVCDKIRIFAQDREWAQFHTPRNITLAMMGEVGELAELFQWRSHYDHEGITADNHDEKKQQHLDKVSQEVADVSIYLLRLADVCGVVEDLGPAALKQAEDAVVDGRS